MTRKKRVLIIAVDPWRDDSNGGNVFTNLFSGWKNEYEFAQIYFRSQFPNNKICKRYYQLSEKEMIKASLTHKAFGREIKPEEFVNFTFEDNQDNFKNPILSKVKNMHLNIVNTIINFLWLFANWKTKQLNDFIDEFQPDYIFAPLNNSPFILKFDRYIAERTGKKIISYVSDDHLSYRQKSLSPLFWLNRMCVRNAAISTTKYYSLLYTMTDEQLKEYSELLHVPMKILRKGCDFSSYVDTVQEKEPYTIIYGGNLLYGRISTVKGLVEAVKQINQEKGKTFEIKIFTPTYLSNEDMSVLNDGENSFVLGRVSQEQLNDAYSHASIALHVDSFEKSQRLSTRLSFSTKIVDLLHTGCCVMAICWKESSPFKYLSKEDAAICIDSPNAIYKTLKNIADNPLILHNYSQKAWDCGARNHNIHDIQAYLKADFERYM